MASGGGHEPNLTPLIDLFSVLIVFLLMTASWLQLESVQVQVEQKSSSSEAPTPPPMAKNDDEKKVKLSLVLYSDRVVAQEDNLEVVFGASKKIPGSPKLLDKLKEWKQKYPTNNIVISSESTASYGQLIRLYDFVSSSGWSEIGINPY